MSLLKSTFEFVKDCPLVQNNPILLKNIYQIDKIDKLMEKFSSIEENHTCELIYNALNYGEKFDEYFSQNHSIHLYQLFSHIHALIENKKYEYLTSEYVDIDDIHNGCIETINDAIKFLKFLISIVDKYIEESNLNIQELDDAIANEKNEKIVKEYEKFKIPYNEVFNDANKIQYELNDVLEKFETYLSTTKECIEIIKNIKK